MADKTVFWYAGLTEGTDNATDRSLTIGSELLRNVSLDQYGNWATRKGADLLKSKMGTNPGYGLWEYKINDGTQKLMAVTDEDLFVLNETTGWGSAVDTNEWTASKRVDGINFLNRVYIGSEDGIVANPLAYSTGSTITDLVPNVVSGSILAVNKNILSVGLNSTLPNVIFYTNPFTDQFYRLFTDGAATATCAANADATGTGYVDLTTEIIPADAEGGILYNSTRSEANVILDWTDADTVLTDNANSTANWDDDTVYLLQNVFKQDNRCTGMINYGENFVSFDENKMYRWDPTSDWSDDQTSIGCVNYRTVKVVNGFLIWVSRTGIHMFDGDSIRDITGRIRDEVSGFGMWDLIQSSSYVELCAGVRESKGEYWLSIGTASTVSGAPGSALTNVVYVFSTKTLAWTQRDYPDQFLAFSNFTNSTGSRDLYAIGKTDAAVWKLDTGTTDDDSAGTAGAFTFEARTPHHQLFDDPTSVSKVDSYYVKYSSSGTVTVTTSEDEGSYGALATLAASSTPIIQPIRPRANKMATTHSMKFSSTAGDTIIEAYGIAATKEYNIRRPFV